jgi:CelD/BcsL family acetyltransferase involved in cellulose biosynthesis
MLRLDLEDERWAAFVGSQPRTIPFHHPAWARLLADCYGYEAFALAVPGANGELVAGLPVIETRSPLGRRRWISLAFSDFCPPLGDGAGLGEQLDEERRRAGIGGLEIRDEVPGAEGREVAVLHTLSLDRPPEELFSRFHRSQVQRNVKRAEKGGVQVRRGRSAEDLVEAFYALHLETRRRQGVPVQPRRFFRLLWERMLAPGLGFVSLAEFEGRPVAGAVFLRWGSAATYKFGASDPRYLRLRPNHLIFWDAISTLAEDGVTTLDFGRTDLDNRGLREFKSGWGATETPLVYTVLGEGVPALGPGRAARALSPVIRRSPSWVCRALGERLYRYAA